MHSFSKVSFNSLQTGKGMQSIHDGDKIAVSSVFQFPSNGKGHAKCNVSGIWDEYTDVSIPFKRERACKGIGIPLLRPYDWFQFPSNGKGHAKSIRIVRDSKLSRFNSLQTGKGMQRFRFRNRWDWDSCVSIPFKRERACKGIPQSGSSIFHIPCFNSLQTGKGMQSGWYHNWCSSFGEKSFNSLQTGKGMQSSKE